MIWCRLFYCYLGLLLLCSCASGPSDPSGSGNSHYENLISSVEKNPDSLNYDEHYIAYSESDYAAELAGVTDLLKGQNKVDWNNPGCVAPIDEINSLLSKNFLSVAVHYLAMHCYQQQGEVKFAEKHEKILHNIFNGMFAAKDGRSEKSAINIVSVPDIETILLMAGYEGIDMVLRPGFNGSKFYFIALVRDPDSDLLEEFYFSNNLIMDRSISKKSSLLRMLMGKKLFGVTLIQLLADSNDYKALVTVGDFYRDGQWLEQNHTKAFKNYEAAVQQGSIIAHSKLADLTISGLGTKQDFNKAIDLLIPAVDLRLPEAEIALASLYYTGNGVEVDHDNAELLLEDAATQIGVENVERKFITYLLQMYSLNDVGSLILDRLKHHAEKNKSWAALELGRFYSKGYAGDDSMQQAETWFSKAIQLGAIEGYFHLGKYYTDKNEQQASSFYRQAAEAGNIPAMAKLCWRYHQGIGINRNQSEAIRWCEKGAEADNLQALNYLAVLYGYGLVDSNKSLQKQFNLYWLAANNGLLEAQYNLANSYYFGTGIGNSNKNAAKWFAKAAIRGHIASMYKLAEMYRRGLGLDANDSIARLWFAKAAANGYLLAINKLAFMYANGSGVSMDLQKARELYQQAADQGDDYASYWLHHYSDESSKDLLSAKIEIRNYGIYQYDAAKKDKFLYGSNHIPARIGLAYFFYIKVTGLPDGDHDLTVRLERPELVQDDGSINSVDEFNIQVNMKAGTGYKKEGWVFEKNSELVTGEWLFKVYHEDKLLATNRFFAYLLD